MNSENFTYWIKGLLENKESLNPEQTELVKNNLDLVDKKDSFCAFLNGYLTIEKPKELDILYIILIKETLEASLKISQPNLINQNLNLNNTNQQMKC